MASPKECYDHLGNRFESESEMCRHYGIPIGVFKYRIKSGWSLKDTLTQTVTNKSIECYDHLGNRFKTQKEMCNYYGITSNAFHSRVKSGWSLEDALTKTSLRSGWSLEEALIGKVGKTGKKGKGYCDHLGNKYDTIKQMCEHYNVNICTFESRIKSGRSLEEALTKDKNTHDHLGNKFTSAKEMCEYHNISYDKFRGRIKSGWSLKDALENRENLSKNKCTSILGKEFKSLSELYTYYGILKSVFISRMTKLKWEIIECIGIKGRGLDASIKNNEVVNTHIINIKFGYTGLDTKVYYTCTDKETGEELLLNADEILMYKQSDYKTAVEQLIRRRKDNMRSKAQ